MKLTVGGRGGREETGKTISRQTNIYVRWGKQAKEDRECLSFFMLQSDKLTLDRALKKE